MAQSMSKFEQIITFIHVVEENGFAAAARKQHLSTAAVSRQIGSLETELGVPLLQRTTRQITLTEVGMQYFQHCKKVLGELTDVEAEIKGSQNDPVGILKITSGRYFAEKYLIPKLPKFMAQNPNLQIKLELAERFPDLVEEEIDVLFGTSLEGPPGLVRKRVMTTRYVLCASPTYLEKYGIPQIPADLTKHRYITHAIRRPDNVIKFKEEKKIYVEPILWLNDSRAMLECALQDMGIVDLHDYFVSAALQEKKLIEVLADFREPPQPVFLYYQQSRYLQPKIRRFIDFYASQEVSSD